MTHYILFPTLFRFIQVTMTTRCQTLSARDAHGSFPPSTSRASGSYSAIVKIYFSTTHHLPFQAPQSPCNLTSFNVHHSSLRL